MLDGSVLMSWTSLSVAFDFVAEEQPVLSSRLVFVISDDHGAIVLR
jgi:hypothetical protein